MRNAFRQIAQTSALALALGLGLSGAVQAAPVNCPGTASYSDREFTLDTSPNATCFAYGTGNVNGNPLQDPLYALLQGAFGAGHVLIDKSDDGASGLLPTALSATSGSLVSGLSGGFSFVLPAAAPGYVWTNIVLALKSGEGRLDPDWAAFLLPSGVTSGTWAIAGKQALSHVNLYAQMVPAPVPLPAAGGLLALGLMGMTALSRRRRA